MINIEHLTLLILSSLFVALRFLGRRVEHVSWWWDDWTILISLVLFAVSFATDRIHPLISGSTKISGLLLYLIHFGLEKRYARPTYVLLGIVGVWIIATLPVAILQYHHPALAIIEAVIDLAIMIITFPGSYSIDWIFGRGILITTTYTLGVFDFVTSILRVFDPRWTKIQEGVGIIVVCLWPSAFGLLAVFTCSLREPKSRVFAHFRQKTRQQITDAGFGALLSDSPERKAMEENQSVLAIPKGKERIASEGHRCE